MKKGVFYTKAELDWLFPSASDRDSFSCTLDMRVVSILFPTSQLLKLPTSTIPVSKVFLVFTGTCVCEMNSMCYLNLPGVVGYDEAQQYDCRQADETLQGQRIHGAL